MSNQETEKTEEKERPIQVLEKLKDEKQFVVKKDRFTKILGRA